jgi:hypothetical protein
LVEDDMLRIILGLTIGLTAAVGSADERSAVIDWSAWDAILAAHVDGGVVDYDGVATEPGFRATVESIATARLDDHDLDERLAFLINAYNVLAVKGILDGSSPRTAFGKLRFFYRDKHVVAGDRLSLNALEHERIRTLGEPRIHFAIVCASASCPPLRGEAYLPDRLDEQLDDNARRFLNDPTKNRFDLDSEVAELSKIFKWFEEDFEAAGGLQAFIARFVADDDVAEALGAARLDVRYLDYDWSLNGTYSGAGR